MEEDLPVAKTSVEGPPQTPEEPASKDVSQQKPKGPRKRTKTGCLTCRKRRIKCGEEKPRCNNCFKSKRECEGYGQRVVFRQPVGPVPHLGPIHSLQGIPGAGAVPMLNNSFMHSVQQADVSALRPPLLPIAPRPTHDNPAGDIFKQHQFKAYPEPSSTPISQDNYDPESQQLPWNSVEYTPSQHMSATTQSISNVSPFQYTAPPEGHTYESNTMFQRTNQPQAYDEASAIYSPHFGPYIQGSNSSPVDNTPSEDVRQHSASGSTPLVQMRNMFSDSMKQQGTIYENQEKFKDSYVTLMDEETENPYSTTVSSSYEMGLAGLSPNQVETSTMASYSNAVNDDAFLTTYRAPPLASPLTDPEVARVFFYFIKSVGPALSIFERHGATPAVISPNNPVPMERQGLWTYTLPIMALKDQGLLQAILAFSSHHIAKMNGQAPTASLRHYHYALRRVGKNVGVPHRRTQVSTFAATMLLGFFEVMGGEHSKWNRHLAGATQLAKETDFAGMTRDIRAMRARARAEHSYLFSQGNQAGAGISCPGTFFENDIFAQAESGIDPEMISTLMGRAVNYDEFGHVGNDTKPEPGRNLTAKDIEEFRIRTDLYWWFCKNDLFQSLISGNPLMVPFDRWGQCPPRAAVGKLEAVYGTMDHLVLLLGRIASFVAKDRKRKLKVMEENGGEWRPSPELFPPEMSGHRPDSTSDPPSSTSPPAGNPDKEQNGATHSTSPPMYGMIPPPPPVRLPSGFAATAYPSTPSPGSSVDNDLSTATAEAEAEWRDIFTACEIFGNSLGPNFAPLPPDGAPVIPSPFGPALQYRTHTIGCVWAFYYTARIVLQRAHPAMPPAAMMAAAVAAPRTDQYAQLIGRIIAGVPYQQSVHFAAANLSPTVAAVLQEFMISLFFAGVQYTDAAQREWTISKLCDLEIITGGNSPRYVAYGCEAAWVGSYNAGRGPPWKCTIERTPAHTGNRQGPVPASSTDRQYTMYRESEEPDHWAMGLLSI